MKILQVEKPYSENLEDILKMCDNVKLIKTGNLKGSPVKCLFDEL
jgi:hypothetical protein